MTNRPGIDVDARTLMALRAHDPSQAQNRFRGAASASGKSGRNRGSGVDLYDLRDFVDGDDLRHVDPSASARTGKLHVKTFTEERDVSALIVLDLRASMFWGSRTCLRAYAAICAGVQTAWHVANAHGQVAFLVVHDDGMAELSTLQGDEGMVAHCEHLALIYQRAMASQNPNPPKFGMALLRAREMTKRQTGVFVFTGLDDLGEDFRSSVTALHARDCRFHIIEDALQFSNAKNLPVAAGNGQTELIDFMGDAGSNLAWLDALQIPYERLLSDEVMV